MMTHDSRTGYPLNDFYSRIYRRYDLINRLFTFGMDVSWRKYTAARCLENKPGKVLDLCCGTADLALEVRKQSGEKHPLITGYDFNEKMLSVAREKAEQKAYSGMQFLQGDAADMPFESGNFDAITIGFGFRNLTFENPHAEKHLTEMGRILRSGGYLLILESSIPQNQVFRFLYRVYLKFFLIPAGGLLSGNWKAYSYLANSSANFFSYEEVTAMLSNYGFGNFRQKRFFMGAANLLTAQKLPVSR